MSSKNRIADTIKAFLIAGRGDTPFICNEEISPEREIKRLKKRLRASENWQVYKDTIRGSDETPFNGIASWGTDVTMLLNGRECRFRVLQIDRLGLRTHYAIPINMVDNFSSLPGIDLNTAEISLIKQMSNELSTTGPVAEIVRYISHPAKSALVENREQWNGEKFDLLELLGMIRDNLPFRDTVIAALAAQYRSFLLGSELPEGIYNFVIPPQDRDSDVWFYDILQALTFVNNPGKNLAGPITITMKDADDLKRWKRCHERLAVLRTSTGTLLWPLLEEIEERDQFLRSGGPVYSPLPTVPISLTKSYLQHAQVVNIFLPRDPPTITDKQLDLLRAAMSRLLRRKIAKAAFEVLKESRTRPTAYRTNGFSHWHEILLETCLQTWFPEAEYQSDRNLILTNTQRQREEQERVIAEKLQRALDLLTESSKYSDQIIERPSSHAEWDKAVKNGALAFWYEPKSGNYKGTSLLAFTSDTLKKLIARVGCTEELYDAFCVRCRDKGLLNKDIGTIRLGRSGTISAVTFFLKDRKKL